MKGMILAAGLGTRLRPLTESRPKALVEIRGRTLLQITLERLREARIREVIINVHHFADMIVEYLETHRNFDMEIAISREEILLDTGGGLKKAGWFFGDSPFVLHNVDVISTIDLERMARFHVENDALVTLAVQQRRTSRYLLFDDELRLCGRSGEPTTAPGVRALAFAGIHIVSPRLIGMLDAEGVFSIIPSYLELAGRGEPILGFRADEYSWRDMGRLEAVREANQD